jgi:hypothetical protein
MDLILTAIGCTAAATSALVWAIAGVKQTLAVHIAGHEVEHKNLDAKILKLERRKK